MIPEDEDCTERPRIPVVGIGASAGGLLALEHLLSAVKPTTPAVYVVIQHLMPSAESQLVELLARHSGIPVEVARDGMELTPGRVVVIPPSHLLSIRDGRFRLEPLATGRTGARMPVDHFFRSMAEESEDQAVAVVLSGTGSDGTFGAGAVRQAGGLVIAQDPNEAEYADMPRSLVTAGLADRVLPVQEIPATIDGFFDATRPRAASRDHASLLPEDLLSSILAAVQARTRFDFRSYKKKTLVRRIRRRMGLRQITDPVAYYRLIQQDEAEVVELRKDMLIGVTGFFREPEAFAELQETGIRPLVQEADPNAPIRVWVPGCSTGEEAYSLLMLFQETARALQRNVSVQIFASDIDEAAIEKARLGFYPASQVEEQVSPERIRRFFAKEGSGYRVEKSLREHVIFSLQNVISDPPFSRLDLVSCRNVLIYLEPRVQRRIISVFAFALRPGRFLFLGKSDNAAGREDLFERLSRAFRIYRRRTTARPDFTELPVAPAEKSGSEPGAGEPRPIQLATLNTKALLEHFSATVILIDARGRILHFFGEASRYLTLPTGEANLEILSMAREKLALKLRPAIHRAIETGEVVAVEHVPYRHNGDHKLVKITVRPVWGSSPGDKLLAVFLEDEVAPSPESRPQSADDANLVQQLEQELRRTREELQSTYEEFETSNEELRAANEEVMSMNEELQSANEELETSKEELQSINEELTTVNNQLSEKLDELGDVNNDLANLLNATQVASVFLDPDLRVKRFTQSATAVLNLIEVDVGRPIGHISQRFEGASLKEMAERVLKSLERKEAEVRTHDGRHFTLRVFPYRTLDNRIDGVIATFTDITDIRRAEDLVEGAFALVPSPLLVLDMSLTVTHVNGAFCTLVGCKREEAVGRPLQHVAGGSLHLPEVLEFLARLAEAPARTPVRQSLVASLSRVGRRRLDLAGVRLDAATRPSMLIVVEALRRPGARDTADTTARDAYESATRATTTRRGRVTLGRKRGEPP